MFQKLFLMHNNVLSLPEQDATVIGLPMEKLLLLLEERSVSG
jgi:hypothetical protein